MSILLEALRKTEKNRQVQQVPNIHTDEQNRPEQGTLNTGSFVAMIAVAMCVTGWFTWHQYAMPEGVYRPPVTLAASQPQATQSSGRDENSQAGQPVSPADDSPAPTRSRSSTLSDGSSRPQRTPVEGYQAPATDPAPSTAGRERLSLTDNSNRRRTAGDNSADPGTSTTSGTSRQSTRGTTSQYDRTSSAQSGSGVRQATEKAVHIPEPIGYWELPDSHRAQVPEIKFSVLVYNKDPAERFVLINGQRLAEGDSVQPGLLVDEIRRDGVIFSYRLYKFLVKR